MTDMILRLPEEDMYNLLDVVLFVEDHMEEFHHRMKRCGRAKATVESYEEWDYIVGSLDESITKVIDNQRR